MLLNQTAKSNSPGDELIPDMTQHDDVPCMWPFLQELCQIVLSNSSKALDRSTPPPNPAPDSGEFHPTKLCPVMRTAATTDLQLQAAARHQWFRAATKRAASFKTVAMVPCGNVVLMPKIRQLPDF
ncbi:MAG: hypothetical protein ACREC9_11650 [Methylocella sp.]